VTGIVARVLVVGLVAAPAATSPTEVIALR
jgi:hypothetical protein